MNFNEYATLAPTGTGGPAVGSTAPATLLQNYNVASSMDGYTLLSNAIDLRNVQQLAATCSFLSGSTIAGTLSLQVSNDKESQGNTSQPIAGANWTTITAPTTSVVAIVSGAQNVTYNYPLIGHRWIRFNLAVTSGSGNITFCYNLRSA